MTCKDRLSHPELCSPKMVERYEALRWQALKGRNPSASMNLFLSRGMALWMQAWRENMFTDESKELNRLQKGESWQSAAQLPETTRSELITALANLVFNIQGDKEQCSNLIPR